MRSFAAVAAASLSLAAPASTPNWVLNRVALVANGLGDSSPRITVVRLNVREHGKLVDHVWARGDFTCNICMPRSNTHLDVILDARTHSLITWHVWN